MDIDLQKQIIKEYVKNKLSLEKIGEKYNYNHSYIAQILEKNGIKRRNLSVSHIVKKCDNTYFENIDTEEKAYFLGFMYADGTVVHNMFRICLHQKDLHILESFKKSIQSEHKIISYKTYKSFGMSNEKISNDLRKLGCLSDKTYTLKFPTLEQVPKNLIRHFIRGFFDGDGSINYGFHKKYKYVHWRFDFIGTFDMVNNIKNIFSSKIDNDIDNIALYNEKRKANGKLFYFRVGGNREYTLQKIYDYLYKDATIFLTRKYNKFHEIIRLINENTLLRQDIKDESIEKIKDILMKNNDKPIWYVAKLLNRKDLGTLGALYKKYNIPRKKCFRGRSHREDYIPC